MKSTVIRSESVQVLKMQLRHKYVKAVVESNLMLSKFAAMFREGKVPDKVGKSIFPKSLNYFI